MREQVFWRKKHSGVLKQLGGCSRGEGALGRGTPGERPEEYRAAGATVSSHTDLRPTVFLTLS